MGWVAAVGSLVAKQISRKDQLISDNAAFTAGASGEDESVAAQSGKVGSKKWATVSKIASMAGGMKGGDKTGGAASESVESVESADMAAQTMEPMAAGQVSTQAANAAGQAGQAAGQVGQAQGDILQSVKETASQAVNGGNIVQGKLNVLGSVKKAAEVAGKAVKGIGTNVYEYVKDENAVTGADGKIDWGKTAQKQINKRTGGKPDKSGMMAYQQTTAEDEERRRRQQGGGKYNVK